MARCPFAHWRPIAENNTQPIIKPTQYLLHSAVDHPGRTDLRRYFARDDVKVESHFWVYLDGTIDQYLSTDVRADANSGANRRPDGTGAVSVETEDEGNPDERPWTAAQVKSLVRLGVWLHETHGIPARQCRTEDDPGIGYHTLFGAPSKWTSVNGKTCPGHARVKQFPAILRSIQRKDSPVTLAQAVVVPQQEDHLWDRPLGAAIARGYGLALVDSDEAGNLTYEGRPAKITDWTGVVGGGTVHPADPKAVRIAGDDRWGTAKAVFDFIREHDPADWNRRGWPY